MFFIRTTSVTLYKAVENDVKGAAGMSNFSVSSANQYDLFTKCFGGIIEYHICTVSLKCTTLACKKKNVVIEVKFKT